MPRPDPRFLPRSAPFAWILLLAAVPCILLSPARAGACPYPPTTDLWTLTSEADRILLVEVEELRRSRLDPSLLHLPREVLVEVVSQVSLDLGLVVDETLPEVPSSPIFVATVRVLDDFSASPDVAAGSRLKIVIGGWAAPVVPGHSVLFFLRRNRLAHRLLPYGNAALYFTGESDLRDLESVIASALALQANGHGRAPAEWRTLALSLPGSRGHARTARPNTHFDRATLARALALFPDDPSADLNLLRQLRDFESTELDHLAAAWVDALLAVHKDHGMLDFARVIAFERWSARRGLELCDLEKSWLDCREDRDLAEGSWNSIRDRLQIPHVDTSVLLERLESNRQTYVALRRSMRDFRSSIASD